MSLSDSTPTWPLVLRIAIGYMLVRGVIGLIVPVLRLGPNHPEFQAQGFAYRVGAKTRELVLSVAYIVVGVGLLRHEVWGRMLTSGLLAVATIYEANAFAWGISKGPPSPRVRLVSNIVVVAWNAMWFYLIYRATTAFNLDV
jgi:hypothetical protein